MNLNNKKILVLGMGREGRATVKYLASKYPECEVSTADKREPNYPESLEEWDLVFVTPGIPPHEPLLKTAREITTATNLFLKDCKGKIVGVTGSKGKSTTASLINAMLPGSHLVGNIGVPGLEILRDQNNENDVFVFEMSSAQASRLVEGPDVAVVLNLFPEHLDYHGNLEDYYAAKLQITMTQKEGDVVIFNKKIEERIKESKAQKMIWGASEISDNACGLIGEHNKENIRAAMKTAQLMGANESDIKNGLREFKPLPHRLELVGEHDGVKFYNDSISTAPEATIAALEALDKVGVLILGGLDRGYEFEELAQKIVEKKVQNLVLFPETGARIKEALKDFEGEILETESMEDTVKWAHEKAEHGTCCVLSPGAPSYNLYKNFEERGEAFKSLLKLLGR
ncbi:UDP-N-acetylmuramoyl-L-alanine--D-glutamate ligase [Candidatus Peregrinibacteria bacterium]|jgi:UDP-N-acetylmuramoyl-L-alanine---L-glutamate ligase|nr:UDP-N-acetylmuramoyl-L-alanine--D-glutamate ligase [Candidatus Peregrinibacteria bacterium]MBT7484584.1 UDP-N-acetylmuramoyl-L-alanine--D-glutamate ligase [Candidatus Peregrinibacteria bacterium]MBT7702907.1 UDP-N-acetylmuramoyl-L-alanine--D-glutamate ligase [Candidatus Peregrinibacteria bacterium]